MFDENDKVRRPRFDAQTGERIDYGDEVTGETGNEAQASAHTQTDSQYYRYTGDNLTNDARTTDTAAGDTAEQETENNYSYSTSGNGFYSVDNTGSAFQQSAGENAGSTFTQGTGNSKDAKAAAKAAKKAARKERRKNSSGAYLTPGKRAVRLVLSGLVFGAVAGCTMFGVYYSGVNVFPVSSKNVEIATVNPTTASSSSYSATDDSSSSSDSMDVKAIAKAAMPAVVAITGTVTTTSSSYSFNPFGSGGTQEASTSGTGIIIGKNDTELLMVTNAHVVDDVNNLQVTFVDNKSVSATVKGSKSDKDIAVVAVNISDIDSSTLDSIAIAELGDSDSLEVGESVVAIGNALGEGQSVTVGWVSALNRSITIDSTTYENLIMTDAAINPGNSGGALLNSKGQVIGINSAKASSSEVEGMGYAIPISSVSDIIDSLMNRVTRNKVSTGDSSYLGIGGVDVTSTIAQSYGYPQGIMIQQVESGSAAEKAGLAKNDIIVSFDGEDVKTFDTLKSTMQYYAAGETVTVGYYHMDGGEYKLQETQITLGHNSSSTSK